MLEPLCKHGIRDDKNHNIDFGLRRHPCTAPFATKKSKRADTSGSTNSGV
jgi:hypothetical protein